jgi:hypothetical protein
MHESATTTDATTASDGRSVVVKVLSAMNPRAYFGTMGGVVHGVREFVWLGMAFVYPVWVVGLLVTLLAYWMLVAALWVLFMPLRLFMRVTHKGNYARTDREAA